MKSQNKMTFNSDLLPQKSPEKSRLHREESCDTVILGQQSNLEDKENKKSNNTNKKNIKYKNEESDILGFIHLKEDEISLKNKRITETEISKTVFEESSIEDAINILGIAASDKEEIRAYKIDNKEAIYNEPIENLKVNSSEIMDKNTINLQSLNLNVENDSSEIHNLHEPYKVMEIPNLESYDVKTTGANLYKTKELIKNDTELTSQTLSSSSGDLRDIDLIELNEMTASSTSEDPINLHYYKKSSDSKIYTNIDLNFSTSDMTKENESDERKSTDQKETTGLKINVISIADNQNNQGYDDKITCNMPQSLQSNLNTGFEPTLQCNQQFEKEAKKSFLSIDKYAQRKAINFETDMTVEESLKNPKVRNDIIEIDKNEIHSILKQNVIKLHLNTNRTKEVDNNVEGNEIKISLGSIHEEKESDVNKSLEENRDRETENNIENCKIDKSATDNEEANKIEKQETAEETPNVQNSMNLCKLIGKQNAKNSFQSLQLKRSSNLLNIIEAQMSKITQEDHYYQLKTNLHNKTNSNKKIPKRLSRKSRRNYSKPMTRSAMNHISSNLRNKNNFMKLVFSGRYEVKSVPLLEKSSIKVSHWNSCSNRLQQHKGNQKKYRENRKRCREESDANAETTIKRTRYSRKCKASS